MAVPAALGARAYHRSCVLASPVPASRPVFLFGFRQRFDKIPEELFEPMRCSS
jgi:hypothetical protein